MPEMVTDTAMLSAVDFSVWNLFLRADWVVKLVMLTLLLASFWSWAIIFHKFLRYRKVEEKADKFEEVFWSGNSLEELYERVAKRADHPMALLFVSAMREWSRGSGRAGNGGRGFGRSVRERVDKAMSVTMSRELEDLERYLDFLATVGSTAPFIGLFGTVWGIMTSFQAIAVSHNSSLAVVAPGIAEALFATALGLVAAIPAVIGYNRFTNQMARYGNRLSGFADEFSTILSRQTEDGA
ncbi:MAG TPA: protein TolQ [Alphaproteobacteria bacterium]|nr:protein TolQ [Alphaproteobacteria bacterium]HAM46943.1 protein TolQ [Alphaproteobacteria bacterium]HBA42040.1 protein TolQ [Alphaproteobacteria bacterium]HBC53338.1 protein TolQ [Alphaproteobacteria bacterium]HBF99691.1 protein TolQ [Alphaproteobacteria bacterium]